MEQINSIFNGNKIENEDRDREKHKEGYQRTNINDISFFWDKILVHFFLIF